MGNLAEWLQESFLPHFLPFKGRKNKWPPLWNEGVEPDVLQGPFGSDIFCGFGFSSWAMFFVFQCIELVQTSLHAYSSFGCQESKRQGLTFQQGLAVYNMLSHMRSFIKPSQKSWRTFGWEWDPGKLNDLSKVTRSVGSRALQQAFLSVQWCLQLASRPKRTWWHYKDARFLQSWFCWFWLGHVYSPEPIIVASREESFWFTQT